jgi:hypothetical protein
MGDLILVKPKKPEEEDARAPELMTFIPAPWSLDDERKRYPEVIIRGWIGAFVRTFNGFGVGENKSGNKPPEGRHLAYGNILFPFVGDEVCYDKYSVKNHCEAGLSSCGLTVRSLWLLLGARHKMLNPPYLDGTVMTFIRAFSVLSEAFMGDHQGALKSASDELGGIGLTDDEIKARQANVPKLTWDNFDPRAGDTVFINREAGYDEEKKKWVPASQHVSTIVEVLKRSTKAVTYVSCDGGQQTLGGDATCCSIRLMKRTAYPSGGKIADRSVAGKKWVTGLSNVMKLPFPAKVITPYRNSGRFDLPDPGPWG